jgi:NTP pyrophosphatase (non-canonical NTP hydrolase)
MSENTPVDRLGSIRDRLRQFVAQRDWSQFHDPKNLAMAIASEAGELLAELRWVGSDHADQFVRDPANRERIEREVGDIAIALLLFSERAGIDLLDAIERKIELNAKNYPPALSKGRSERPSPDIASRPFSKVIAVDWSGAAAGGHETIWVAEVTNGTLTFLNNGLSRDHVIDRLIELKRVDPNFVVGLDFAFALPRWFSDQRGLTNVGELWDLISHEGERWLRECQPPFWGRPGRKKPPLPDEYRQTDTDVGRRGAGQAKSVFQIGGAGAVGTGSLRGMPHLARLRSAGFSVWPFDAPFPPLVVEIYPRVLTGAVVKSSASARKSFLDTHYPALTDELGQRAVNSEDAFDAAVSALVMWAHAVELASLPVGVGETAMLEGAIWAPAPLPT